MAVAELAPRLLKKSYHAEGTKHGALVSIAEFHPDTPSFPSDEAVVFQVGWPWDVIHSSIWPNIEDIANAFKVPCFGVSTRLTKASADSSYLEADGLCQFLVEREIKKVTFFGHSDGGQKAIAAVARARTDYPKLEVPGLVLASPKGLYTDSLFKLGFDFGLDLFKVGPEENKRAGLSKDEAPEGFTDSLLADLKRLGIRYPTHLYEQLAAMCVKSKHLGAVDVPVTLIMPSHDPVSRLSRIFPRDQVLGAKERRIKERSFWGKYQVKKLPGKDPILAWYQAQKARERIHENYAMRELLAEIFPNSPVANLVVFDKLSGHVNWNGHRSPQVTKVADYMISRSHR